MIYNADFWIKKRKELWNEKKDIEFDSQLRRALAKKIIENEVLRKEVIAFPERFIELFFVIVDKRKQVVPFFLNEVQREFAATLNHSIKEFREGRLARVRILILKGRQQGFTSFITAYQLACSMLRRNFEGYTLADVTSNATAIFDNKAKFPKNQLPELLKPTEQFNNKKQLKFSVLNSTWEVGTATKNVGRSRTVNFFHGSEAAFWEVPMSDIQAALGEALTKDCIEIYETTANGFNDYKDMWDSGVYINCFYEWWKTGEYTQDFESKTCEEDFKKFISESTDWIGERIRWLLEKGISMSQCYWYYKKYQGYIDKDTIKQEYPCTPEEAFLMSGRPVFDLSVIVRRIADLREKYEMQPYRQGCFCFEWHNPDTQDFIMAGQPAEDFDVSKKEYKERHMDKSTIRFSDNGSQWIRIYEEPQDLTPYVISGDTKGEGSDYYAATVINNITGNRAASLHMQLNNSKPFTHQLYCLGMYYNKALIGVEMNFNTGPIEELVRLGYPYQYTRRKYDTYTGEHEKRYGWKTDGHTRPLIIDNEIEIINEHIYLINDIPTLEEALTFVYDDNGRPDAMTGKHDDLLVSEMIANELRKSQSYKLQEPERRKVKYTEDMLEDWNNATEEERKMMYERWGAPDA